jgi:hypothetical protein
VAATARATYAQVRSPSFSAAQAAGKSSAVMILPPPRAACRARAAEGERVLVEAGGRGGGAVRRAARCEERLLGGMVGISVERRPAAARRLVRLPCRTESRACCVVGHIGAFRHSGAPAKSLCRHISTLR